MPSDRFTRRVLQHVSDRRYRPTKLQELAQSLGIQEEELQEFTRTVTKLIDDGQVVLGTADTVALPPPGREVVGVFRQTSRGFGFIISDTPRAHGDLFVPAPNAGGAMTGDRVRAKVLHDAQRGAVTGKSSFIGKITEILQRADKRFVGNLRKMGSQWVVEIDGQILREPVIVRDPHAKNAKAGDKVVVELIEYPRDNRPAQGVITEVLGEQGEPDVETSAVIRAYGLSERFPEPVLREAHQAALGFAESAVPPDREDLTRELIVTIDPPDAKDYDDAISIRKVVGGQGSGTNAGKERIDPDHRLPATAHCVWELGVHIAHVAHFVKPDGVLDTEARRRANSTYLPRRVVPMLPELLSNGVCSLQEGVPRYCLSAFIRYDAKGNVVGQRFSRSVIRSAKRLTYREAQALIDNDFREAVKHAKGEPKYSRPVMETLKLMDELARVLQRRRMDEGMIVLDLPAVELIFDETGRVVDAEPEDNAFTHKIIEMFMVEANEAAARLFDALHQPMIRRIHPEPPSHDMNELRQFAHIAGFTIPLHPNRKQLQGLIEAARGKPVSRAVHLAVLRTLARAEYSPELIGHFALASEHYTHFTSPIRRYPDLIVHRGLDAYLDALAKNKPQISAKSESRKPKSEIAALLRADPRLLDEAALYDLGKHCSLSERNSAAAENDLRTYLVLDLLREHLGEDYDGTVTGVTNDGVYIQLNKYLVDGFVRTADLPGLPWDRWRINRQTGALVAQRSGKSIRVGDAFVVRIANVNPVHRKLEMVIVSQGGKPPAERRANLPEGFRKQRDEQRRLKRDRRKNKKKK